MFKIDQLTAANEAAIPGGFGIAEPIDYDPEYDYKEQRKRG